MKKAKFAAKAKSDLQLNNTQPSWRYKEIPNAAPR
jgi:hypothetical protein